MDDTMKKIDIELKKRQAKEWFDDKVKTVGKWYYDHEEQIRAWAPIIVPAVGFAGRQALKSHNVRKETRAKELYHWDPRRGEYYMSRRPLKSSEQLELDRLYSLGYSKGEALKRMKLLK